MSSRSGLDEAFDAVNNSPSLLAITPKIFRTLAARDLERRGLEEENASLVRSLDAARDAQRALEAENHDLKQKLRDTPPTACGVDHGKHESEMKRLVEELRLAQEAGESHKANADHLQITLEGLRARHEGDIAAAHRTVATLEQSNDSLRSTNESQKDEIIHLRTTIAELQDKRTVDKTSWNDTTKVLQSTIAELQRNATELQSVETAQKIQIMQLHSKLEEMRRQHENTVENLQNEVSKLQASLAAANHRAMQVVRDRPHDPERGPNRCQWKRWMSMLFRSPSSQPP